MNTENNENLINEVDNLGDHSHDGENISRVDEVLLALTEIKAIQLVASHCVNGQYGVDALVVALDKINNRAKTAEYGLNNYLRDV